MRTRWLVNLKIFLILTQFALGWHIHLTLVISIPMFSAGICLKGSWLSRVNTAEKYLANTSAYPLSSVTFTSLPKSSFPFMSPIPPWFCRLDLTYFQNFLGLVLHILATSHCCFLSNLRDSLRTKFLCFYKLSQPPQFVSPLISRVTVRLIFFY